MSRVIRFDLSVDQPERATRFYSALFGWRIEQVDGLPDYWLITTGDDGKAGIDGGMVKRRYGTESTMCWIFTPSVDETLRKVTELGGKPLSGKIPVPGAGYCAYCQDTESNIFGVLQLEERAT